MSGDTAPLLPTGNIIDVLDVAGFDRIAATLLTAGNPTVFVDAAALGLSGAELPDAINADPALLARCEAIRSHAAVLMGLAPDAATATRERPATPKLSWIAPPDSYRSSSGVMLAKQEIDVLARILSMGKLHHAYTGTGAIAVAVAAVLPGSIVERCMAKKRDYSGSDPVAPQVAKRIVWIGHASGRLSIGASVSRHDTMYGGWSEPSCRAAHASSCRVGCICLNCGCMLRRIRPRSAAIQRPGLQERSYRHPA